MTVSSAPSAPSERSLSELAAELRRRGMRLTPQRERVMAAVTTLVHATPEQVFQAVPEVDLTTVYRTLEVLEEIGLLAHTHLGHGAPSYRLASDDHVHVVCHTCAKVVDAPPGLADELVRRLREERDFILDLSHFTVFGTCSDCAATTTEGARTEGARSHRAGPGDADA